MKPLPRDTPGMAEMMEEIGKIAGLRVSPSAVAPVLDRVLAGNPMDGFRWRAAALRGFAQGASRSTAYPNRLTPMARLAAGLPESLRGGVAERIERFLQAACDVVANREAGTAVRLSAIHLLGESNYETSGDALAGLLSPQTLGTLQVAALESLAKMKDDRVGARLVAPDTWNGYTASVRAAASNAMMTNLSRTNTLLRALEEETIAPWSIDSATRNRLQRHRDAAVRRRAREIFEAIVPTDRNMVYEEYKSLLSLSPEPENGRAVFGELCSQCHVVNGEGHDVGPDLTGIRSQPVESILLHVLVPNWLMVPGFETYLIETKDFETHSGLIVEESENTITLRQGLGIEKTIRRSDIKTMETSGLSMMPEELEASMTRQQLRDLIGYLKGEISASTP